MLMPKVFFKIFSMSHASLKNESNGTNPGNGKRFTFWTIQSVQPLEVQSNLSGVSSSALLCSYYWFLNYIYMSNSRPHVLRLSHFLLSGAQEYVLE